MAGYEGLTPDFQSRLMNMIAASGGRIYISSGYRSVEEQQALWEEAVARYGEEEARNWVAPPGSSNHNHGLAADIAGDLAWAHANAEAFGLYFPMPWENWHIEPIGTRETNTTPGNVLPPGSQERVRPATTSLEAPDPGRALASLLGIPTDLSAFTTTYMPSPQAAIPNSALPGLRGVIPPPPSLTPETSTSEIDKFMAAIRSKESSNNYHAIGPSTEWGRATGAYQFIDSTWGNYKGYARAMDAPPEVQDERARDLMLQYYQKFGNWSDVAAAWYSGPGGDFARPDIAEYSSDVLGRMG